MCKQNYFIGTNEVLLAFSDDPDYEDVIIRGPIFKSDILKPSTDFYGADYAASFERYDRESRRSESVTEDIAQAWLKAHESDLTYTVDDEDIMPVFVRTSSVWADALEDGYVGIVEVAA